MRRLGIVGHRHLDAAATAFVFASSLALIGEACAVCADVVAVSALSEGADTLFAEAALELGVPFETVRPFDCYEDDFATGPGRRRYGVLVDSARRETRLPFSGCSTDAYESAMRWVAEGSDVLVAAWDGSPPRSRGGTADTIRYAESIGRSVVHLDVVAQQVVQRGGAMR